MNSSDLVLGIDSSTQSTKVIAWSRDGHILDHLALTHDRCPVALAPGTQIGAVSDTAALASRGHRYESGDSMTFAVDPGKLHLLDARTEQRIN